MMLGGAAATGPSRVDLAATADFDLGGVRVRPARRQISTSTGDDHELEPRVMQVLVALAGARGEVVSRDRLIEACWDGRIVGDDSLNRCVVALRKLAASIDPPPFTIETVPRVGYSLIEREREAETAAPVSEEVEARPESSKRRLRAIAIAAAALVLAAVLAAALLWRPAAPAGEDRPQLRLAALRSLSADLPAASAEGAREELVAAFEAEDAVMLIDPDAPPPARGPDLILGGTIQQADGSFRFTLHMINRGTGATLYSQKFDRPATLSLASRQVAVMMSQFIRCGVAQAGRHLYTMTDAQLSLWLQVCSMMYTDVDSSWDAALDVARKLTEAAPDFANGWVARALVAFPIGARPEEFEARRAEAAHAVEQALRLDPENAVAYRAKALSLPAGRFGHAEFERLMQRAVSLPVQSGAEHSTYGEFLVSVGRHEDARVQYARARDVNPLAPWINGGDAQAHLYSGRGEEGYRILRESRALWPQDAGYIFVEIRAALSTGRYDDGLRVLDDPAAQLPAEVRTALRAAFEALRTRDPARSAEAVRLLRSAAANRRTNLNPVTMALAALGDHEGAIASAGANNAWMHGVLFSPAFAETRKHSGFVALAEKFGMIRYWRETGRLPDFCRTADPPAFCRTLQPSRP